MLHFESNAQDAQFTQFYANPIFLNPAFTGVTFEHRFVLNYRNQWPGISKTYSTYAASYDYNLAEIKSGIGGYVFHDRSGIAPLVTTNVGFSYAYHTNINKFTEFRSGIQFSLSSRNIDYTKLTLNDQFITQGATTTDPLIVSLERTSYIDVNAGALINSIEYWGGIAVHHLNGPNASLNGSDSKLPMKLSLHGGYRFIQERKKQQLLKYFSLAANYKHEAKFDQLDIGAYYFHMPINLGIWYRGLPLKHYQPGYRNSDALSILLGWEFKEYDLRVGYSYDLTLSRLISKSAGSHEVSVIYEIAKKNKRTRKVLISCPKF